MGLAIKALYGVGDPTLGEWIESNRPAFHIRRRLTDDEAQQAKAVMCDMRGAVGLSRYDTARETWIPRGSFLHIMAVEEIIGVRK